MYLEEFCTLVFYFDENISFFFQDHLESKYFQDQHKLNNHTHSYYLYSRIQNISIWHLDRPLIFHNFLQTNYCQVQTIEIVYKKLSL
ncbi:hypothetical protein D3C72_1361600 [compost metagenome]